MSDDTFGYSKMGAPELRKAIADLVRSLEQLIDDKKDLVAAANDSIKSVKERLSTAVVFLTDAEHKDADAAHESNVRDFLKKAEG